jgi:tRNA modification GTPase
LSTDTIAAIASPPGIGAIAMIRMSGPRALDICEAVFRGSRKPARAEDRTVFLGEIMSGDGMPIDQVLVTLMRRPRSLTGEDVIEITCHGGNLAPRLVLRRLIEHGARPAEPGEFTKRAFLNGKMDLTQAEAVSEIVHASSEKALKVAMRQLRGELGEQLAALERTLLDWLALIEANIDFVDDEIEAVDSEGLGRSLEQVAGTLKHLLAGHEQGRYIRQGLDVAIVGRPNVGKSSLFNRLVGSDRVIVSETPGTTRDIVDGLVSVNGMILRLHDTAGLGGTGDLIEAEAVKRARRQLNDADIALVVLDISRPLSGADLELTEEVGERPHLIVANKSDLPQQADLGRFSQPLKVSALEGWGLPDLLGQLQAVAHERMGDLEYEIVVSERHAGCIQEALSAILRAMGALGDGIPLEFIASDVRQALNGLGEVTGRDAGSRLLDEIFSRFCIGK